MGSRVLSRSFTLNKEEEEDEHEHDVGNSSIGSAMDIDGPLHNDTNNSDDEEQEDEDEEEVEVVMVPLADILNARYNTENVQRSSA